MHKIEVDDEIFALLQREAEPFVDTPNDVLRRRLLANDSRTRPSQRQRRKGPLAGLIAAGYVAGGDEISFHEKRKGQTHLGEILPDGWVRANGKDYDRMSPSLGESVGYQINGWFWLHKASGRTLREMREELKEQQSPVPTS
jgi:hypothetical protein